MFHAAALDMERENGVDADVVEAVWERIAPGALPAAPGAAQGRL